MAKGRNERGRASLWGGPELGRSSARNRTVREPIQPVADHGRHSDPEFVAARHERLGRVVTVCAIPAHADRPAVEGDLGEFMDYI